MLLTRKTKDSLVGQLNESAAAPVVSDFARRLMAKYGWEDGKGLGGS